VPFSLKVINKSPIFQQFEGITDQNPLTNADFMYIFVSQNYCLTLKKTTMNKAELIDAIAASAKLTKADAGRALDATIDAISKALKKGDRIGLVGFGSFSVTKRSARTGRNPQTGKEIKIPAKKVVKFKAGAELSGAVNKGK
jgi:DNA-binding protein HU-beta